MTLFRFLILFSIGVVLAFVTEWVWLAWVLAVAATLVVIQLVRN